MTTLALPPPRLVPVTKTFLIPPKLSLTKLARGTLTGLFILIKGKIIP